MTFSAEKGLAFREKRYFCNVNTPRRGVRLSVLTRMTKLCNGRDRPCGRGMALLNVKASLTLCL